MSGAALPLDDLATLMTQHRRKGAQCLVYSRTIREHVETSGIHDNDVCALGVPRCSDPANCPAEVVRRPHRVTIGRLASSSTLLLHNVSVPDGSHSAPKLNAFAAAVQQRLPREVDDDWICPVDMPRSRYRCSSAEWSGSCISNERGSPNTVDASSNVTPCFRAFDSAFSASHSNS